MSATACSRYICRSLMTPRIISRGIRIARVIATTKPIFTNNRMVQLHGMGRRQLRRAAWRDDGGMVKWG